MAQTAEEIQARAVTKDVTNQLYGIHKSGSITGEGLGLLFLYNRKMILNLLGHANVDEWLTADEQAALQGKLIIKS